MFDTSHVRSFRSALSSGAFVGMSLLAASACSGEHRNDSPNGSKPDIPPEAMAQSPEPAEKVRVDGGFQTAGGSTAREDRFVVDVVSFMPGPCAGFGASAMPEIVRGPPEGAGTLSGSLDVVSLGVRGEIVVSFGGNAIVDGPGADFIVFENAFWASGDPNEPANDLGDVSVSEDGRTWVSFPCAAGDHPPYEGCAGWRPVMSSSKSGISPFDVERAGGEAFDLAQVGLTRAKFVRIRDLGRQTCPDTPRRPINYGFDLDAVAIVHAEIP